MDDNDLASLAREKKYAALDAAEHAIGACLKEPGWTSYHHKRLQRLRKEIADMHSEVACRAHYQKDHRNYDYD